MVIDTLDQAFRYEALHPHFKRAFDFLRERDVMSIPEGRMELDGDRLFALTQVYVTKPVSEGRLEAHRKYIDIQYIVSGEEDMGYAPLSGQTLYEPFNEEKDMGLYRGEASFTKMTAGMIAIFFPHDAHLPSRFRAHPVTVRKIVLKVACEGVL